MVRTKYRTFLTHGQQLQGSKFKKSSGHLLATNWRNIVASLYNVNDTAHSMVPSIRFDCLKKLQTEVDINNYYLNGHSFISLVHTYLLLRNHVKTIDDALNLPTMVMLTVALCPVPTLLIGTQVYTPSVSTVMLSTPELLLLIKESLR